MRRNKRDAVSGAALVAAILLIPAGGQGTPASLDVGLTDHSYSTQELPPGVTPEKIAVGNDLYRTRCATCHGALARGARGRTGDLTDGVWTVIDNGTIPSLVKLIVEGVTAEESGGFPMPATRNVTDEQAEALAAYVWSINQGTDDPS